MLGQNRGRPRWVSSLIEPEPTRWSIGLRCAIFLATNCLHPILVDIIKFNGAAKPSTALYVLPTYYAMLFFYFIPTNKPIWEDDWKSAVTVAITDLVHQAAEKVGLLLAGSAVYIVIGSSSIVWTAVLAMLLLGTTLDKWQWAGIICICSGLAARGAFVTRLDGSDELLGIVCMLGAACLHGLSYVYNERCLTGAQAIEGPRLVFMIGAVDSTILTAWVLVYTLPRWDELVVSNVRAQEGNAAVIVSCFLLLLILALLRSASLWYIIKHIGAIGSGVLKGLRTAVVFVVSHFLFCDKQESQCMTPAKALSAALCVIGVVIYSTQTAKLKVAARRRALAHDDRQVQPEREAALLAEEDAPDLVT